MSEHEHRWHDDLRQMETCGCGKTRIVGTRDPADDSARHWRNLALNTEAKWLRAEAKVERLRAGIEELAATGEADGRGNSRALSRRLRALLDLTRGTT